ncbi:YciI family protein [Streptosporangium sp. CA-115845]|uniref:YciI family protein n=1 Tax=Streptosporangium sp. CA-115845 TaxID=3240071 RepID=UPI003D8B297D
MKYLMLVCTDPGYSPGQDDSAPDVEHWVKEMDDKGIRLMGNRTRPASDATTVRVRNGEVLLTDGPYAEAKDQIAGFDILDCADLDEAGRRQEATDGYRVALDLAPTDAERRFLRDRLRLR